MDFKLETSWERELKDEFNKPYFEKLIEFIEHEYQIYPDSIFPKKDDIFKAFEACPFDKVITLFFPTPEEQKTSIPPSSTVNQRLHPPPASIIGQCFTVILLSSSLLV